MLPTGPNLNICYMLVPDDSIYSRSPPKDFAPQFTREKPRIAPALPSDSLLSPLEPAPGPSGSNAWASSDRDSFDEHKSSDSSERGEEVEMTSVDAVLKGIKNPKLFEVQFQDHVHHCPLVESAWKQTSRLYDRMRGCEGGRRKLRLAVVRGEAERGAVARPVLYVATPIAKILGTSLLLAEVTVCHGRPHRGRTARDPTEEIPLTTAFKDNTFCVLPTKRKKLILPEVPWIHLDQLLSSRAGQIIFGESHLMLVSLDETFCHPLEEKKLYKMVALMNRETVRVPLTFGQNVKIFFSEMFSIIRFYTQPY